tara:strand:- start:2850 stop:4157 length:1308 start_codon:yes stop_codon:yes gene_type:complete
MSNSKDANNDKDVPFTQDTTEQLSKILVDMIKDLLTTFPELKDTLDTDIKNIINEEDENCESIKNVQKHCEAIFPERFFDILYQNEDIFTDDKVNTEFLPNIDFAKLWQENITENTKQSMWKYLQVILFNVVTNVTDQKSFGDTAKLFEAINQDEFKKKLEDTIREMQNMFATNVPDSTPENGGYDGDGDDNCGDGDKDEGSNKDPSEKKNNKRGMFPGMENLPDPKELQDHISEMMDGKLGNLAKEIAEETAKDMDIDMTNSESVNDVFQKLFKQPTKLMSLVKNVGSKLDEKMKSGDIKESELLEEANNIMQKMKSMPGMGNMKEMFEKMGMPGNMNMPGKMNMGATAANLKRNMRGAQQRDRMREKLARRQEAREQEIVRQEAQKKAQLRTTDCKDGIENKVFTTGEVYEKSAKRTETGNKKKKRKKKLKKI